MSLCTRRDLERADELSPSDKSVREALSKARSKAAELRAEGLKHAGENVGERAGDAEERGGGDGNDKDSLEQVMHMLRAARSDSKNLSDQQRRDSAARAAQQVSP